MRRQLNRFYLYGWALALAASTSTIGIARAAGPAEAPVHPEFQNFEFKGQPYQYYEVRDQRDRVVRQVLLGTDRVEIMIDSGGTGYLDSWEIDTPRGRIVFSGPSEGQFTFMEVQEDLPKGSIRYKYHWNSGKSQYSLYETKKQLRHVFADDDFIVGCRGDANEKRLETWSEKLDEGLRKNTLTSSLREELSSKTLDGSCREKPFSDVKKNIVDGLMKIATSDENFRRPKVKGNEPVAPPEKGSFLQCLRYYGMDVHASRIESAFAQYTSVIPEKNFMWQVSCGSAYGNDISDYLPGSMPDPPTIEVHGLRSDMGKYIKQKYGISNPTDAQVSDAYARTLFHELLHYSLIEDDTYVHPIEDCCGDPSQTKDSASCKAVAQIEADRRTKQVFENVIVQRLGNDGYKKIRDILRNEWSGTEGADATFNGLVTEAASAYNRYLSDKSCGATKDRRLGTCGEAYKAEIDEMIQNTYGADKSTCNQNVSHDKNLCARVSALLKALSDQKFDPSDFDVVCPTKAGKKTASASSTNLFTTLVTWASRGSSAGADDAENSDDICAIARSIHTGKVSWSDVPLDRDLTKSIPNAPPSSDYVQSSAQNGKNDKPLTPSPTNTKSSFNKGPERPIFANDSTARQQAIEDHLQSTDALINRLRSTALTAFDTIVPRAQAETTKTSDRSVDKDTSSTKSRVADLPRAIDNYREGVSMPSSRNSVANPLGAFGSNGAGGASLPTRDPASVSSKPLTTGTFNSPNGPVSRSGSSASLRDFSSAPKLSTAPPGANVVTVQNPNAKSVGGLSDQRAKLPKDAHTERALKALLAFLQREDYENVKQELQRPTIESSLLDHEIQVIDDESRVRGAGHPVHLLSYDAEKRRLVLEKRTSR